MVLPALASARGAEILFEAVGRDGCEVPGVRIQVWLKFIQRAIPRPKHPRSWEKAICFNVWYLVTLRCSSLVKLVSMLYRSY